MNTITEKKTRLCSETLENQCIIVSLKIFIFADRLETIVNNKQYNNLKNNQNQMKQDMIVILDLGSHENTVLARAIRALGVYSEIYPHDITVEELKALPKV